MAQNDKIQLFEDKRIRTAWDEEKEEWYFSLSKKSSKCWAFSDRYGRMGKGDERCWNAGKWIETW